MGQYYKAIILGPSGLTYEHIRTWLCSFSYGNGTKLMEHSYLKNKYVCTFERLLCPEGMFYMSRAVWAGDYADKEPNLDKNLHELAEDEKVIAPNDRIDKKYRFLVNHTKKQYVDKEALESNIHPLPLLLCEGNGRGGGDYHGVDEAMCGLWARDVISVEEESPEGYAQLLCRFGDD